MAVLVVFHAGPGRANSAVRGQGSASTSRFALATSEVRSMTQPRDPRFPSGSAAPVAMIRFRPRSSTARSFAVRVAGGAVRRQPEDPAQPLGHSPVHPLDLGGDQKYHELLREEPPAGPGRPRTSACEPP